MTVYKTNTVNRATLPITTTTIMPSTPVAYITLTDLVIGDIVSVCSAVEVTTEKSYNMLYGRFFKVDTAINTSTSSGDIICTAATGPNFSASPAHHGMLVANGFHQVTRNGSAGSPHIFQLVAYTAASGASSGDTCVVNYVEIHLKVN